MKQISGLEPASNLRFTLIMIAASALLLLGLFSSAQAQRSRQSTPGKPSVPPVSNKTTDVEQLFESARTAAEQDRFDVAIRIYNQIISLSASDHKRAALANVGIGNVCMLQRKFENAVIAYGRAVRLDGSDPNAQNNLGEALGELKQYRRALEAFNKAAMLDPRLSKALYNQAVTYDRMGNFKYSEFVFRNLIKAQPAYALAYDGLAVTLSKAGRPKEAIAFHDKAIALDPKEASYYYNLAISYLIQGNTAKAIEQQEKLKTLDASVADRLASVIVKRQL